MDENKSESSQFLEELGIKNTEGDIFKGPTDNEETSPESSEQEENSQEEELRLKNRREKRLAAKLQAEREANIALNARVQALSEVGKFREEVGDDTLKEVEAIFGTDTPEKVQATNILKKALSGMSERAVQRTLEKIQKQQGSEVQAVREEESNLDNMMDEIEDNYDIDFSSSKDRQGFLELLEKASPKDADGNIIEYADPDAVAELYISRRDKTSSRARELAARSGTRSGASQPSTLESDAREKWLRENDII